MKKKSRADVVQQQQQPPAWPPQHQASPMPPMPSTIQPMQAHNQSPFTNTPWYSPHNTYGQPDMSRRDDQMGFRYGAAPQQQAQQHHATPVQQQPSLNVGQQQHVQHPQGQHQTQHQTPQHGQHQTMHQTQQHQQQHQHQPVPHAQQHNTAQAQTPQQQATPTPAPAQTPRQRKRPAPSSASQPSPAAASATPASGMPPATVAAPSATTAAPATTPAPATAPAAVPTPVKPAAAADDANSTPQPPPAKKGRTNTPWTAAEELRLKQMRDAGNSWAEIAKTFPTRTEGSVKKHWYKDMHYAEFAENESQDLLNAIKEYEASKWKVIGTKVGKPAKACEQYAKEHFPDLFQSGSKAR